MSDMSPLMWNMQQFQYASRHEDEMSSLIASGDAIAILAFQQQEEYLRLFGNRSPEDMYQKYLWFNYD